MSVLSEIRRIARQNPDGFTIVQETQQPVTDGFSVAYKETQNSFGGTGLFKAYNYNKTTGNKHIGGWLNTENNKFYFDAIKIFQDRDEAIKFGREQEQIAIYDLNKGKPIYLK